MVKKACPKCNSTNLVREGNYYVCANCLRRIALNTVITVFDSRDPLDRLEEQYVEGFISREEYQEKKRILRGMR